MKIAKKLFAVVAMALLVAGLGGCSYNIFIGQHKGAEWVSVVDANQVAGCQPKSGIIVSVFAKGRIAEDVEANLLQMARNSAVDAGADTIVKGESPEFGKRAFSFYKCRP